MEKIKIKNFGWDLLFSDSALSSKHKFAARICNANYFTSTLVDEVGRFATNKVGWNFDFDKLTGKISEMISYKFNRGRDFKFKCTMHKK